MDENKPKYSVVGTVTIGTDEYRDLIEDTQKAIQDKDYYMREGWSKDTKIRELKDEVSKLTDEVKKLKSIILKKADTATKEDFVAMFFSAE